MVVWAASGLKRGGLEKHSITALGLGDRQLRSDSGAAPPGARNYVPPGLWSDSLY